MAAINNDKYNVLIWMNKLLFSCDTVEQVESMKRLTTNYKRIYPNHPKSLVKKFLMRLDIKINQLKKSRNYDRGYF